MELIEKHKEESKRRKGNGESYEKRKRRKKRETGKKEKGAMRVEEEGGKEEGKLEGKGWAEYGIHFRWPFEKQQGTKQAEVLLHAAISFSPLSQQLPFLVMFL